MASSPAVATTRFLSNIPSAVLDHLAETPRLARVTAASHLEIRPAPEVVSSGIVSLDALIGGLPRGGLTEITGPDSSGRTSVLLAALAAATQRGEICALIDATDSFHPHSAAAAGIDLARLLWVRCTPTPPARSQGRVSSRHKNSSDSNSANPQNTPPQTSRLDEWKRRQMEDPVEQALRAADLLLQSGGFGLVAIDLAGVPVKTARRVPLTTWFRFRRVIEATPTVLLLVGEQPCAQTCASLGLRMTGQEPSSVVGRRSSSAEDSSLSAVSSPLSVFNFQPPKLIASLLFQAPSSGARNLLDKPSASESLQRHQKLAPHVSAGTEHATTQESPSGDGTLSISHVNLLEGLHIRAELLRARTDRKPAQSVTNFSTKAAWAG
jgi:hypothetical protein